MVVKNEGVKNVKSIEKKLKMKFWYCCFFLDFGLLLVSKSLSNLFLLNKSATLLKTDCPTIVIV